MADTVTLVADMWCPYNCAPQSAQPGYVVEISRIAYEKAGLRFTYKLMPWKRAVIEAKNGKYNGIIGFTKKQVKGFIITENEMGITRDAFFIKIGERWRYTEVSSLKEVSKVGYPNGYHYTDEIDAYFEKARNVYVISGDNPLKYMVKMLLIGRIDTFPENEMVVNYFLKRTRQTDKLAIAGEFSRSDIYVGFGIKSPTHRRDMKILSDGIQMLRSTGELDAILDRYGIKDWR